MLVTPIATLTVSFLMMAATSDEARDAPTKTTEAKTMVRAKAGETFTIVIESNITTGYEWKLTSVLDKRLVELIGSKYEERSPEKKLGAPGRQVFTFKAAGAGEADITLAYVRPWEKKAAAKTKTFHITIDQ